MTNICAKGELLQQQPGSRQDPRPAPKLPETGQVYAATSPTGHMCLRDGWTMHCQPSDTCLVRLCRTGSSAVDRLEAPPGLHGEATLWWAAPFKLPSGPLTAPADREPVEPLKDPVAGSGL